MTATELIRQEFMSDIELANILNITKDRVRDLKSKHRNGKVKFIDSYSPSSTVTYFRVEDVRKYILDSKNDVLPELKKESQTKSETIINDQN